MQHSKQNIRSFLKHIDAESLYGKQIEIEGPRPSTKPEQGNTEVTFKTTLASLNVTYNRIDISKLKISKKLLTQFNEQNNFSKLLKQLNIQYDLDLDVDDFEIANTVKKEYKVKNHSLCYMGTLFLECDDSLTITITSAQRLGITFCESNEEFIKSIKACNIKELDTLDLRLSTLDSYKITETNVIAILKDGGIINFEVKE